MSAVPTHEVSTASEATTTPAAGWRMLVLAALVAVVGLWPAMHRVLVLSHNVSPWKLGAWAMYCVPPPQHLVEIDLSYGGRVTPLRSAPPEVQAAYDAYGLMRASLGELADPRELALAVLHANPAADQVRIRVRIFGLNTASAMIEQLDEDSYVYAGGP